MDDTCTVESEKHDKSITSNQSNDNSLDKTNESNNGEEKGEIGSPRISNSSSTNVLNSSAISNFDEQTLNNELENEFSKGSSHFITFMKTKVKSFTTRANITDPSRGKNKQFPFKSHTIVLKLKDKLNIHIRFIDDIIADDKSDKICESDLEELLNISMQLTTLADQFDVYDSTYTSIISNSKPLCESKRNDIEFCVASASENITLRKKKSLHYYEGQDDIDLGPKVYTPLTSNNKSTLSRSQLPAYSYDISSKVVTPAETNRESPAVAGNLYHGSNVHSQDPVKYSHSESNKSSIHDSSLDYKQVQFNELPSYVPRLNASWREFTFDSDDLAELNVIKIIKSISKATLDEVSSKLSDAEIMALDKNKRPLLEKLNDNLIQKGSYMSDDSEILKKYSVEAFKASSAWLEKLEDIVNSRKLHLTSDRKYNEPLKLEKFSGYKDNKTNIYEFMQQFNLVSRGLTMEERAHYLFSNYLSDDIKRVVRHCRDDFIRMKRQLVERFGDVNRLLSIKKAQIKALPSIHFKSNTQQKLDYVTGFVEVLDQIKTLVDLNIDDYPAMGVEIFSHSNVMSISALLPKFLHQDFACLYVKERENTNSESIQGSRSFELLLSMLKRTLSLLEFSIENYNDKMDIQVQDSRKDRDRKGKDKVDSHSLNVVNTSQNVKAKENEQDSPMLNVVASSKFSDSKKDSFIKSVCFVHDEPKKKLSDCFTGRCPTFLNMSPANRLKWADKRKMCHLCFLYKCKTKSPDKCIYKSDIPIILSCTSCSSANVERNVLLCPDHKNDNPKIKEALTQFLPGFEIGTSITMMYIGSGMNFMDNLATINKAKAIDVRENSNVFDVSNGNTFPKTSVAHKISQDSKDKALYPMQLLNLGGQQVLVLYDSGAMGEAIQGDIAERLELTIVDSRPQSFRVAGGGIVSSNNPLYETTLGPDVLGNFHTFPLLGMDKISEKIPLVNLEEMGKEFKRSQVSSPLSKEDLPASIGGSEIQLIIGIRRSSLFPTRIMVLESGLQIWRSQLQDVFGSTLIFAGPHKSVRDAYNSLNMSNPFPAFFHSSYSTFRDMRMFVNPLTNNELPVKQSKGYMEVSKDNVTPIDMFIVNEAIDGLDESVEDTHNVEKHVQSNHPHDYNKISLLGSVEVLQSSPDSCNNDFLFNHVSNLEKILSEEEAAGSIVDFRCNNCNNCQKCKESMKVRAISIKDQADDILISNSVKVDLNKKESTIDYPFTKPPDKYLRDKWGGADSNFKMAENVFKAQCRKSQEIKDSVIKFHNELLEKGYVIPLHDLPQHIQDEVSNATLKHFFPWRSVFKAGSVSTPARIVIDPSMSSFNEILAKGSCCLTNLYQIIVNWRSHKHVFVSDISKMFNSLKLNPEMFKYSLYLFSESLDPSDSIIIMVICTLMYGLRSAANQCTHALQQIAIMMKEKYPLAYIIIMYFTYMDDSSGGDSNKDIRDKMVDELVELLPLGGFKLKVVTKSGESPCEKASNDGIFTTFSGYKWAPLNDILMLNSSDLNFNPKRRGIKKANDFRIITDKDVERLVGGVKLTHKALLSKVHELYDPVGLWEPIKARLKLDLQMLKNIEFDKEIPIEFHPRWIDNLKLIHNAKYLECNRAFIPIDAVNADDIELLVCSDAATSMAGCAVYARFLLKDGTYSCQLVSGRSRTCYYTIPRNELEGCALAAQTAYTITKTLGARVKNLLFVTDSTIACCWISNQKNKLLQFVNARVQLIHRLVGADRFFHIAGELNPSDLLTRGNVTCEDVANNSRWQNGDPWMRLRFEDMPIKSYSDICTTISSEEQSIIDKESFPTTPVKSSTESLFFDSSAVAQVESGLTDLYHELLFDPANIGTDNYGKKHESCKCKEEISSQNEGEPCILRFSKHLNQNLPKISVKKSQIEQFSSRYLVNFVSLGFKKALRVMAIVCRFVLKTRHKCHVNRNIKYSPDCSMCFTGKSLLSRGLEKIQPYNNCGGNNIEDSDTTGNLTPGICSPLDFFYAWKSICQVGSQEVRENYKHNQLIEFIEKDGIFYSGGRLSFPVVECNNPAENPLFDGIDYVQPVFPSSSEVTYSLCMYVHWELAHHAGIERTMSFILRIIHVEKLRNIVKYIRQSCPRCRYLQKKHFQPITGNQATYSLMRVPVFYCSMIDICGNFDAYDFVKKKATTTGYFFVQCCLVTGAVSIGVLEDLSTCSIILALSRSGWRYGWPKYLVLDNQSSFTTLKNMKVDLKDLQGRLWKDQKTILDFSTPLAHNEHGRVESKVKALKDYLAKSGELGRKHSFIQWECIGLHVASMINGLPLCVNQDDRTSTGELGFICPNHFLIGRNNNRAPDTFARIDNDPIKALEDLANLDNILYNLLGSYLHRFIPGKRYTLENTPNIHDVVLFVSKEAERTRNIQYKFGRVVEVEIDGGINKVRVKYRNATETVYTEVIRNVKDLVLIDSVNDINFNSPSHYLASSQQQKYL